MTVNGDMLQKTMDNGDSTRNFVGRQFWDKMANNGKIFYTNASSLAIPAGTVQVFKEIEHIAMNLETIFLNFGVQQTVMKAKAPRFLYKTSLPSARGSGILKNGRHLTCDKISFN